MRTETEQPRAKQTKTQQQTEVYQKKKKRGGRSESTSILYISEELAGRVRDSRLDFAFENAGRSDWLGWGYEHPPLVVLYA